jgi:pantothenate synthetase
VRSLELAEARVASGERRRDVLLEAVTKKLGEASQARIDYAELRDPDGLELAPERLEAPTLLAIALRFDPDPDGRGAEVRLIDNRVLVPTSRHGRSE